MVTVRHISVTLAIRASSRASAPKDLTVALEEIESAGGDPFQTYSLPEAILKLRQGVGRLIRSSKDRGSIVILDSRILSRPYGKAFLKALPECPVEVL
jgi:ATP-dependent DNA helicase DinG